LKYLIAFFSFLKATKFLNETSFKMEVKYINFVSVQYFGAGLVAVAKIIFAAI
jgi:hypothetical protein